jgi:hypothetical protein
MRLFITHMQDFTPLEWPIISYRRQAVVERLCRNIGANEYLLYVASRKCPTPNMRGKILGFGKNKGPNCANACGKICESRETG